MTSADYLAHVRMGRAMAATNGYRPQQASDLYITKGTSRDYAYGVYRIFSYTFEMSNGDYLDDSRIASETGRNRNAVLYLAERAWCPYGVIGLSYQTSRCGAFDDDFEAARGWAVNPDGTDTATTGRFARANPATTSSSGTKQLGTVASGARALSTGPAAGASANSYDLDGRSSIRSVPIRLPTTTGQKLFFRYNFAHGSNSSSADRLVVSIEGSGGTRTPVFTRAGSGADVDGAWRNVTVPLETWKGQTIRIHIEAVDGGSNSLVEAQIEDVRVTRGT